MTEQQIMSITHDDLVQLFMLRRDDLKAASKEAVRIRHKEQQRIWDKKRLADENYRILHNEQNKKYRENHKEHIRELQKSWFEKNRAKNAQKCKEYRCRKALEKAAECHANVAQFTPHIIITPELLQIPKTVKPERTSSGAMPIPDFELTQVRTDKEAAAYWRQVIDDLEYRYFAKEIDVEAYFSGRNAAMSHLLAAEERMKPKRVRNY